MSERAFEQDYWSIYIKESRWSRWRHVAASPSNNDITRSLDGWGRIPLFVSCFGVKVVKVPARKSRR